ncbi:metallophosphoesterase family protein [Actinoplanes teichomyceticus]|uniref:Putative phosphodiesterase n=1 Tax=Actinoplanes teichomyceticus TaxID=1867 RepID=A0A561VCB4_ACTTI|nr:metallophosphoesterase family protein [Actinoplanes teichomyceticus]TWG09217.1 putative phosphodiesterase [Actinoplanes teichomyceticus]GIF17001.1 phosphoesterase [Actinoplanes teichomyceticus]
MSTVYDRIALISDVHGNLTALQAVLADIDARGIEQIFNLGDYVGKGPRGREVVDICRQRCAVNILGNWDDFLPDPARTFDSEAMAWWLAQLGDGHGRWLRGLPFCHDFWFSGRRVRLFHASATGVHHRVRFDHGAQEFLGMFANTAATGPGPEPTVVGYGDTHDPFYEVGPQGRTLFNTGSVGNSMDDATPVYVILEGVSGSERVAPFSVQFVRVPYDVEAELAVAARLGMPELEGYVSELRHGVYRAVMHDPAGPAYHRAAPLSDRESAPTLAGLQQSEGSSCAHRTAAPAHHSGRR